jgi:hypothetical protein
VVRSARRLKTLGGGGSLLGLVALSGCVTTQQKNARAELRAERIIATRRALHVTRINPNVRVEAIALLRGSTGTAFAMRLRNVAPRPATDLPISVGVITPRGRRLYFNRSADAGYFQTHVAAIAAEGRVTWVFTTAERLAGAGAGRPFADVGIASSPPLTTARTLPRIEVSPSTGVASGHRPGPPRSLRSSLRLAVQNLSEVPQDELPVYAVALRNGRYVAAGRATLGHLGTGARATVEVTLFGSGSGAKLQLDALPTIFQ